MSREEVGATTVRVCGFGEKLIAFRGSCRPVRVVRGSSGAGSLLDAGYELDWQALARSGLLPQANGSSSALRP